MDIPFPLISEVMRLYQDTKKMAEVDLATIDYAVLPGWKSRKNMAVEEMKVLEQKLLELIAQDTAAIFPIGPLENQKAFASLAEDEGAAIVLNASRFYEEIARYIEPTLGPNRTFRFETGQAMQNGLMQMAVKVNALSFIMPHVHTLFGSSYPTFEDLVNVVRDMVVKANGDEFNAAFLLYKTLERVVETEYDSNVVTVVLTGATPEEATGSLAQKVFEGRSVTVDVTNVPDKNDLVVIARKLKPMFKRATAVLTAFNAHKARAAKAQKASTDATNEADSAAQQAPAE